MSIEAEDFWERALSDPIDSLLVGRLQEAFLKKIQANRFYATRNAGLGVNKDVACYSARKTESEFQGGMMLLDERSADDFRERVAEPIGKIAQKSGISVILGGRTNSLGFPFDLPAHSTVEVLTARGIPENKIGSVFGCLANDRHLLKLAESLEGITLPMADFVAGAYSYVCVREFDKDQQHLFRYRTVAHRIFQRVREAHGLRWVDLLPTLNYFDICHMTAARVYGQVSGPDLVRFIDKVDEEVGGEIRRQPLELQIGRVFIGCNYPFFRDNVPHLLGE